MQSNVCVCTVQLTVVPLDRRPVCPDQHYSSNSAFPEATGWHMGIYGIWMAFGWHVGGIWMAYGHMGIIASEHHGVMQDSAEISRDASSLRNVKIVLGVGLICTSCLYSH